MQYPRIRLRTLMIVVAVAAIPAWMARSQDGRVSLILIALLIGGFAVALGLSVGLDRIVGIPPRRDRKD
jgi:hypothetical protein